MYAAIKINSPQEYKAAEKLFCNYCDKEKDVSFFCNGSKKKCRDCYNKQVREYKVKNKEHKKAKDAEYYQLNKDKFKSNNKKFLLNNPNYIKEYREENKEHIRKKAKEWHDNAKETLNDYYVNCCYKRVNKVNLSNELIEIKRQQIKIKRLIKFLKK